MGSRPRRSRPGAGRCRGVQGGPGPAALGLIVHEDSCDGGAGFIGSAVVRQYIGETDHEVVNVDKLTYAGNLDSLAEAGASPRHHFEQVDICDAEAVARVFATHQPDAVMHLAAESHVDRSIEGPARSSRPTSSGRSPSSTPPAATGAAWTTPPGGPSGSTTSAPTRSTARSGRRGISPRRRRTTPAPPTRRARRRRTTSRGPGTRRTGCRRSSPTARTNYGPYHFPEKLIPLVLLNAKAGKPLPVYGKGDNIRDWLYVDDHARALRLVLRKGKPGETYNIGGHNERTNLEVVKGICRLLDEMVPDLARTSRTSSSSPSSPTGPATTSGTRSTPARSNVSSAGLRRKPSKPA